jgi:hypothetical protein
LSRTQGCDQRIPLGITPDPCKWHTSATGKPIYLVGDSHADHFSEGLAEAARELNRPLEIATTNGCPFLDFDFKDNRSWVDNDACHSYVQKSLAYLKGTTEGLVVIANSDIYWSADEVEAGSTTIELTNDPDEKAKAFADGLRRTVEELLRAGQQVLLVQTVPRWPDDGLWEPTRCLPLAILNGGCSTQRSLDSALWTSRTYRATLEQVAGAAKVGLWDPAMVLCPQDLCSTETPEFGRYRDRNHISVPQSKLLAPALKELIGSLGG